MTSCDGQVVSCVVDIVHGQSNLGHASKGNDALGRKICLVCDWSVEVVYCLVSLVPWRAKLNDLPVDISVSFGNIEYLVRYSAHCCKIGK